MANDRLLEVNNLHASVEDREILRGINLKVARGEVHAIMGPNGAGKSTLSGVLAGKPGYTVTDGDALLDGESLLALSPEERSWKGVFLALVKMDRSFLSRGVNVGFSGGEKKRNEIFQMAMLQPRLAILDETDSGLDVDALRIVGEGVNSLRSADNSFVVITHYQRLLDYIVPDVIHVLYDGRIIMTGGKELALQIEEKGYDCIINQQNGK